MIWKIKNDPTYRTSFQTNPSWTAAIARNDPFGPDSGSYFVSIANDRYAHGEIIASSSISLGNNKYSQRSVKTKVYQLISLSGMGTNALINGGGDIHLLNSNQMAITGDVYSNSAIVLQGSHPTFDVTGNLTTASSINEGNGDVNVSSTTMDNTYSPAPQPIVLPGIDFNFFYNQADTILPNDAALDATSTISGITWVNTSASISRDMTINGILVINGNLTINNSADITVNHTDGEPSGIIVNGNLVISNTPYYNGNIIINGLLYTTGSITLEKLNSGYIFRVTGGVTSGNGILMKNCSNTIEIVFNNAILTDSLIPSSDTPMIVIEHWEEEY